MARSALLGLALLAFAGVAVSQAKRPHPLTVVIGEGGSFSLPGGTLLISAIRLIPPESRGGTPEFGFTLINQTKYSWHTISLLFVLSASCPSGQRNFAIPIETSVGFMEGLPVERSYLDSVPDLAGKVDGCRVIKMSTSLLSAGNMELRVDGKSGAVTDLKEEQREQTENDRADADRQVREQAHKRSIAAAQQKKLQAEQDAARAAERKHLIQECQAIYDRTSDKKVSDLTVKEARAVQACESMDMYPPD